MIIKEDGSKFLVVLLIEDDHEWQDAFSRMLRALQAMVLPATDHQQAREALKVAIEQIDLIILDPFIATPFTYDADLILPEIVAAVRGRGIRIIGCSNNGEARLRLKTTGCTHVEPKMERGLHDMLKEHLDAIRVKRRIVEYAEPI